MAFVKKTWKDRLVEYAGRRKITNTTTNESQIVDVERAEGQISEEGSAFSAANMNDLEQRVADEFTELNKKCTDLETSFQDGCSTIAQAITDMGVTTASNASPDTMAENIKSIKSDNAIKYLGAQGQGASDRPVAFALLNIKDCTKISIDSFTAPYGGNIAVRYYANSAADYYKTLASSGFSTVTEFDISDFPTSLQPQLYICVIGAGTVQVYAENIIAS